MLGRHLVSEEAVRENALMHGAEPAASAAPLAILALLWFALGAALHSGSLVAFCIVLAATVVALGVSWVWMGPACELPSKALIAGVVALAAVVVGWAWQRVVFVALIPDGFLPYGYFLSGAGGNARFHLVELPFATVSSILLACLAVALVAGWRQGLRGPLLSVCIWWVALFVSFAVPCAYLVTQGDASIFVEIARGPTRRCS